MSDSPYFLSRHRAVTEYALENIALSMHALAFMAGRVAPHFPVNHLTNGEGGRFLSARHLSRPASRSVRNFDQLRSEVSPSERASIALPFSALGVLCLISNANLAPWERKYGCSAASPCLSQFIMFSNMGGPLHYTIICQWLM